MTIETVFFVFLSLFIPCALLGYISELEAMHDFAVIKGNNKEWHTHSAEEKFFWLLLCAYCSSLGSEAFYGILFYPVVRGITFWPMLNKLLGRSPFHLSDHLMEGWFKKRGIHGGYLFAFYIVFFFTQLFISVIIWHHVKQ